jgi:hypothetical protein
MTFDALMFDTLFGIAYILPLLILIELPCISKCCQCTSVTTKHFGPFSLIRCCVTLRPVICTLASGTAYTGQCIVLSLFSTCWSLSSWIGWWVVVHFEVLGRILTEPLILFGCLVDVVYKVAFCICLLFCL